MGQTADLHAGPGVALRPIPTRVGQTGLLRHPCQELLGPSPHAWGKRDAGCHLVPPVSAHPHTRGANQNRLPRPGQPSRPIPTRVGQTEEAFANQWLVSGPSPHAWGKLFRVAIAMNSVTGPSPHAWGKRAPRYSLAADSTAHPHTRGANEQGRRAVVGFLRPIPTRVGQTIFRKSDGASRYGPSPHAWGKRKGAGGDELAEGGPSPHAWGKRGPDRRRIPTARPIPTRVGQTPTPPPART